MVDISVCIPAYNCEDSIDKAVLSVLSQSVDAKIEILICDDGSTDHTLSKVEELSRSHSEVRLIRNDRNRGRPYTRNHLVREAVGRYLTWLDADDEKYPDMLAHQYQLLEKTRADLGDEALEGLLVFTNFHWIWPNMDVPKLIEPPEAEYHMEHLIDASFGGYLWLMMGTLETFRTVGEFDTQLPRLQDLDFFIRFVQKGGRFRRVATEDALCIYNKDDRARGAIAVWNSWTRIWNKHWLLYVAYGYENAGNWRRHHYRVSRRFAKADNDTVTYYKIAVREVLFIFRNKFRKLTGL